MVQERKQLDQAKKSFSDASMRFAQLAYTVPLSMKSTYKELEAKKGALDIALTSATMLNKEIRRDIDDFQQKIAALEEAVIASFVQDLGVADSVARKIFEAGQQGWEPLIVRRGDGKIAQNRDTAIPRLKVMQDKDGTLKAFYGIEDLGEGTYKRTKGGQIIGGELFARSASRGKDDASVAAYSSDISDEMRARARLAGVKNIVEMYELEYISKKGELKKRYIMKKYDSDLWAVASDPSRQKEAVRSCLPVFQFLGSIHKKGIVHGDIKPSNVFQSKDAVAVGDYGLLGRSGDPLTISAGSPYYFAPETLCFSEQARVYDPAEDLYCGGMLLLACSNFDRICKWNVAISGISKKLNEIEKTMKNCEDSIQRLMDAAAKPKNASIVPSIEIQISAAEDEIKILESEKKNAIKKFKIEFEKVHEGLVRDLKKNPTPENLLIVDLINMDPKQRPHAEEAFIRLGTALGTGKKELEQILAGLRPIDLLTIVPLP